MSFPKTSLSIKVKECQVQKRVFAIKHLYTITQRLDPWLPVTIKVRPALSARQPGCFNYQPPTCIHFALFNLFMCLKISILYLYNYMKSTGSKRKNDTKLDTDTFKTIFVLIKFSLLYSVLRILVVVRLLKLVTPSRYLFLFSHTFQIY